MKKLLISLLLVFAVSVSLAQRPSSHRVDAYIPVDISGNLVSGISGSTTVADTFYVATRNFARVYIGLEIAGNDSTNLLISYAPTYNGLTFNPYISLDSLVAGTTDHVCKYIELPANAMGAVGARVIIAGQAHGAYSAAPVATHTAKVIRKDF